MGKQNISKPCALCQKDLGNEEEGMSEKNGVIAGTDMTIEQAAELIETVSAVNLDEVTNEYVHIQVSEPKEVDLEDNEGNPVLDEDGNPVKGIKFVTRTAAIYDIVPLPIYNRMVKLRNDIQTKKISQEEAVLPMGELVWEIWKISEPFMTKERFYRTVHGETIGALFIRFFSKSRLQQSKVQRGANTTPGQDLSQNP